MRRRNSAHFSVLSECWCCALRWEIERNKCPQNLSLVLDVMSWRHLGHLDRGEDDRLFGYVNMELRGLE